MGWERRTNAFLGVGFVHTIDMLLHVILCLCIHIVDVGTHPHYRDCSEEDESRDRDTFPRRICEPSWSSAGRGCRYFAGRQ
jgi:hypothetical protein